jgi:hypothetical protein
MSIDKENAMAALKRPRPHARKAHRRKVRRRLNLPAVSRFIRPHLRELIFRDLKVRKRVRPSLARIEALERYVPLSNRERAIEIMWHRNGGADQ